MRYRITGYLLLLSTAVAGAGSAYWSGGAGSWDDPYNWIPTGVPQTSDDIYIESGQAVRDLETRINGSVQVTGPETSLTLVESANGWEIEDMLLAVSYGADNSLLVSDGATLDVFGSLHLGHASGTWTSGTISGQGTLVLPASLFIGKDGLADLTIESGAEVRADPGAVFLAARPGGTRGGRLEIIGENTSLQANSFYTAGVGQSEIRLRQGAALEVKERYFLLGRSDGNEVVVTVEGAGTRLQSGVRMHVASDINGGACRAEMTVRDGALLDIASLSIAEYEVGSEGSLLLTGPATRAELLYGAGVGGDGHGRLDIHNGAQVQQGGTLGIGDFGDGGGVVELRGEQTLLEVQEDLRMHRNSELHILDGARAIFHGSASSSIIGQNGGDNGTVTVSGTNSRLEFDEYLRIGYGGNTSGELQVDRGGQLVVVDDLSLGYYDSSRGDLSVDGPDSSVTCDRLSLGSVFSSRLGEGYVRIANGAELTCSMLRNYRGDVTFAIGPDGPGRLVATSGTTGASSTGFSNLRVEWTEGYLPTGPAVYDLLDFSSGSLQFDDLLLQEPEASTGLTWDTSRFAAEGIVELIYAPIPGDVNRDDVVDGLDLQVIQANLGMAEAAWTDGDLDEDGLVSYADFVILSNHFGQSRDPDAPTVPEPTLLLPALLGLPWLRRRRMRQ
jgi:T5SS/PEP-CTERM-associated repeat protein